MIETFGTLLRDPAHWGFELLVGFIETLVFDGLLLGLFWPFARKHWRHHIARDHAEAEVQGTTFVQPDPYAVISGDICGSCIDGTMERHQDVALRCSSCGFILWTDGEDRG